MNTYPPQASALVARYYRYAITCARYASRRADDEPEGEALLLLCRLALAWTGDEVSFRPYLRTAVQRHIRRWSRKAARFVQGEAEAFDGVPDPSTERDASTRDLEAAIATLGTDAELCRLAWLSEIPISQLMSRYDESESTVRRRLASARERLREILTK